MPAREPVFSGNGHALVRLPRGPALSFAPETSYISIAVRRISLRKGRVNLAKYGPYLFGVLGQTNFDADTRLAGVFSPALEGQLMAGAASLAGSQVGAPLSDTAPGAPMAAESFRRLDRMLLIDKQLTPRLVYRGPGPFQLGFGGILQKDYLGETLSLIEEVVKSPVAQFVSATSPAIGQAAGALDVASTVARAFDRLADRKGMVRLAALDVNLRALFDEAGALPAGLHALIGEEDPPSGLSVDESRGELHDSRGRVYDDAPYVLFELRREETRPDWGSVPEVNAAWRVLEDRFRRGDTTGALEAFRRAVHLSPDLVPADSARIYEAAKRKLGPLLQSPAESFSVIQSLGQVGTTLRQAYEEVRDTELARGMRDEWSRFMRCHDVMRVNEGGFVDHLDDPGGATNMGVTQATYDTWRARQGRPPRSVRDIEEHEVQRIYFEGYWRAGNCHHMPDDASALVLFDACVNHGPVQALKFIQRAAGIAAAFIDGRWGPQTAAAVAEAPPGLLVARALDARWAFFELIMQRNPRLESFRRGWRNRVEHLRQLTLSWLHGQESALIGLPALDMDAIAPPQFNSAGSEAAA